MNERLAPGSFNTLLSHFSWLSLIEVISKSGKSVGITTQHLIKAKLGAPIGAIIMLKMLVEYVLYYILGTNATITLIHLNSDDD